MEPNIQTTDIDDEVLAVIATLPTPIQKFLLSDERPNFILRLTQRYGLHADQAGELERAFILMMLGVDNPQDFSNALRTSGISENIARSLLNDINTEVFAPLRKQEREQAQNSETSTGPTPPQLTQTKAPTVPLPSYTPPAPPTTPSGPLYDFSQPAGPIQSAPAPSVMTSAPVPPPAPTPVAFTPAPQNPPVPVVLPEPTPVMAPEAMKPQRPTMRTMVSDVEQMKHGQAPHVYTQGSVPTFTQTPVSQPVPTMAPRETASVPSSQPTHTPPPAIHVTPPPYIPPVAQPPSQTPVPTHPPRRPEPTAEEVTHSLKQYGIDPYREPIE